MTLCRGCGDRGHLDLECKLTVSIFVPFLPFQDVMWKIGEHIGDKEGRMDACVAAAGILKTHTNCLEYPAEQFRQVRITYTCPFSSYLLSFCLSR